MYSQYKIHHIGIAVNSIEDSLKVYTSHLNFTLEHREITQGKLELAFLTNNSDFTRLELISPINNEEEKITKFLSTKGEGLHHICYKVSDIVSELAKFKKAGCELIDEVPRTGAKGKLIAFIKPAHFSGVLTELCECLES